MTEVQEPTLPKAGDVFHVVRSGLSLFGEVRHRGEEIVLTEKDVAGSFDRNGKSHLILFLDEAAQVRRWGRIMIAPGHAPKDLSWWDSGSPEEAEAREQARAAAWKLDNPAERKAELRRIEQVFGRTERGGSRTLQTNYSAR